ncbi:hypothetical protein BDK51DRAFT_46310 [Blyttiomyces helicus]|uniref:Uncharacterized protein n=1 Tax=Blyttiomyces helicus TaxID=388810 RepID=A0A4P9W7P4_9FUNG|nr:hypothetical protein BDK51DRAFT_46310 [Blyttiomyces helicus]|eukprot:RKO86790.1 hypothetical protein BDK51DRAFT_46310 [Blyttiomyces helicus]
MFALGAFQERQKLTWTNQERQTAFAYAGPLVLNAELCICSTPRLGCGAQRMQVDHDHGSRNAGLPTGLFCTNPDLPTTHKTALLDTEPPLRTCTCCACDGEQVNGSSGGGPASVKRLGRRGNSRWLSDAGGNNDSTLGVYVSQISSTLMTRPKGGVLQAAVSVCGACGVLRFGNQVTKKPSPPPIPPDRYGMYLGTRVPQEQRDVRS